MHQSALFLGLALMLGLVVFVQTIYYLESQRWLHQPNENYRQIEALFFLFSTLKVRHPLPPMRVWAVSPDFAGIAVSLVREHRPKCVLELGSGVSTLVTAYALEENKEGIVVSLDHDGRFAAISTANVAKHGLQKIATVIHAPLKEVAIDGKSWLWYGLDQVRNLGTIDMLIVDGPPNATQRLARYPALPVLFPLLSKDAVILLDDAYRADETEIIRLWLKKFGEFKLEQLDAEKGAAVLRRLTF